MKIEGSIVLAADTKLYYTPFSCSLATHIVAREADLAIELVKVDAHTKKTESGADYRAITPRGYVPALVIDGEVHTEVTALLQYLAEQAPRSTLLPSAGTKERFRVNQWLAFVSSELHKVLGWLWDSKLAESTKRTVFGKLAARFAELEVHFATRAHLTGDAFTVADAYAFAILNWTKTLEVDLEPYPNLSKYMTRVGARPKVREALAAERRIAHLPESREIAS